MANLNKVLLIGNLTRDPELRYTPGGQAVCHFGLAVNDSWFDKKTGKREEKATFLRITVWGKQGETCAQYLSKGRSVFVEGRLESRSWETDDGQKRSAIDVIASRCQFLGSRGGGGGGRGDDRDDVSGEAPRDANNSQEPEDDIPF